MFSSGEETSVCNDEYEKLKVELDKANNQVQEKDMKIKELEANVEDAKTYLSLSEDDRKTIDNEITNKQEVEVADVKEENNQGADNKSEVQKDDTVVKSYNSDDYDSGNEAVEQETEQVNQSVESSSGEVVYANGGSSKSNKYHSSPTAHNMEGAIEMSKSQAESSGYVPCGKCY